MFENNVWCMVNAWKLSTALFVRVGLSRTDILPRRWWIYWSTGVRRNGTVVRVASSTVSRPVQTCPATRSDWRTLPGRCSADCAADLAYRRASTLVHGTLDLREGHFLSWCTRCTADVVEDLAQRKFLFSSTLSALGQDCESGNLINNRPVPITL